MLIPWGWLRASRVVLSPSRSACFVSPSFLPPLFVLFLRKTEFTWEWWYRSARGARQVWCGLFHVNSQPSHLPTLLSRCAMYSHIMRVSRLLKCTCTFFVTNYFLILQNNKLLSHYRTVGDIPPSHQLKNITPYEVLVFTSPCRADSLRVQRKTACVCVGHLTSDPSLCHCGCVWYLRPNGIFYFYCLMCVFVYIFSILGQSLVVNGW